MYRVQEQPDSSAVLDNGVDLSPLVTLRDGFGGVAHIIQDDHCYVLTVNAGRTDGRVQMTAWWFREAWEAASSLPPSQPRKQFDIVVPVAKLDKASAS